MRFITASIVLLVFGAVAAAGHLVQHAHAHGHHHEAHEAVSYAEVTKHEDHSHDDTHKHHHGHHEHHVDHRHDHHEHQVEHHGSNGHDEHHGEDHGHVKYEFKYGVNDPKTGDVKEQWEARDGDSVKGGYTLKEADGTTRLVKYTSDKKKGFEATVHKIGHAHADQGHTEHHGQHGHH